VELIAASNREGHMHRCVASGVVNRMLARPPYQKKESKEGQNGCLAGPKYERGEESQSVWPW